MGSSRTLHRKYLRAKFRDRLQQCLFIVDLQLQGMRNRLSEIELAVVKRTDSSEAEKADPIAEAPLSYDRNSLLLFRRASEKSASLLPKTLHCEIATYGNDSSDMFLKGEQPDEIEEFLRSQGHFDNNDSMLDIASSVGIAQELAVQRQLRPMGCSAELAETIAGAQEHASKLRELEETGERETYEAVRDDVGGPEVPLTLSGEALGDYVLGHLDIACRLFEEHHRRPYMQQVIHRLGCRHSLSTEADILIQKVLDDYAPAFALSDELPYMCSQCGALFEQDALKCLVCHGYDIFKPSLCNSDSGRFTTEEHEEVERNSQPSFLKQGQFPEFMRNHTISSGPYSQRQGCESTAGCDFEGFDEDALRKAISICLESVKFESAVNRSEASPFLSRMATSLSMNIDSVAFCEICARFDVSLDPWRDKTEKEIADNVRIATIRMLREYSHGD